MPSPFFLTFEGKVMFKTVNEKLLEHGFVVKEETPTRAVYQRANQDNYGRVVIFHNGWTAGWKFDAECVLTYDELKLFTARMKQMMKG